jgi:hypothetical protein
MRKFIGWL